MKKLILILTLVFTTSLYSQYNLVFNRVVNEQLGNGQTELTVPEGKVWKIQGFFNNGTGNTNSPNHYPFSITKPDGTYLSYIYYYSNSMQNQTIWAAEGDKISMAGSLPNSSNRMALNALEFNLSSATSSGGGSGDSGSGGSGSGGSGSGTSNSVSFSDNSGVPGDDFTDPDGNTYGTTNSNGMIWTTSNYEARLTRMELLFHTFLIGISGKMQLRVLTLIGHKMNPLVMGNFTIFMQSEEDMITITPPQTRNLHQRDGTFPV